MYIYMYTYIIPCNNRFSTVQIGLLYECMDVCIYVKQYMHAMSCFSTCTDESTAIAPAGRLQDRPWARSTDLRCFYKTLLFPIYGSYQSEIVTGSLELLY